jgi:hypothetical protein
MSSTRKPEDQTSTDTQGLFIQCEADRTTLQALLGEVEQQLADHSATILLYGVSPKLHHGFIIVEAARGVPRNVVQWLSDNPEIQDYIIYDAPYDLLRFLREAADIGDVPNLPMAPVEQYSLEGGPVLLLGRDDGRWMARVTSQSEGAGILVYKDGPKGIIFLNADESVDAIGFLGQESFYLLPHTNPGLSEEHQATIEQLHALWQERAQEEPTQAGEGAEQ